MTSEAGVDHLQDPITDKIPFFLLAGKKGLVNVKVSDCISDQMVRREDSTEESSPIRAKVKI